MEARIIDSGFLLEDIEHHFKITAGPGAGKTYWLIRHVRDNVVSRSKRLKAGSRIACISYTNVAVDEIISDLGLAAEYAEVSTIHSFLYKNIVKPYLHLLKDPSTDGPLIDYVKVNGHDEHRFNRKVLDEWLRQIGQGSVLSDAKQLSLAKEYILSATWQYNTDTAGWRLALVPGKVVYGMWGKSKTAVGKNLDSYKRLYWEKEGAIDHEDVLYFACRILEEFPALRSFLAERYPYIFVDEFQDTNPVQTQIVRWLGESGSVIGVIGDPEQSIFQFQGARRQDFVDFHLDGLKEYVIEDNRRSSRTIVGFLNKIRADGVKQQPQGESGESVCVLVGDMQEHCRTAKGIVQDDPLCVLARRNVVVSSLRRATGGFNKEPWKQLAEVDPARCWILQTLLGGVEHAERGEHNLAVKSTIRGIRLRDGGLRNPLSAKESFTELHRRGLALHILNHALEFHRVSPKGILLDFYRHICDGCGEFVPKVALERAIRGKFVDLASTVYLSDLLASVELNNELRHVRTIHKAKGAEFDNVLVCIEDTEECNILLRDRRDSDETARERLRVLYVAFSRAKKRLLLSVPFLTEDGRKRLESFGAVIYDADEHNEQHAQPRLTLF